MGLEPNGLEEEEEENIIYSRTTSVYETKPNEVKRK